MQIIKIKNSFKNNISIFIIFTLLLLIINPLSWILFFDSDGFLSLNKIIFLLLIDVFIIILIIYIFKKPNSSIIKGIYSTFYLFYIILCFELFSFIYINFLINNTIKEQIDITLGNKVFSSSNISWKQADLWSNYKPNPLSIKVNEFGYRYGGGPKTELTRILCIGGSTTWGDGVENSNNTYPAQLEKYLNDKGFNVDVVNAGVPHHTSLEVLMRFLTNSIYTKPDILLIHTGGNDIGPLISSKTFKTYKPDYSHWRGLSNGNNDQNFINYWGSFPSSLMRLILIYFYKPGNGTSTGIQLTNLNNDLILNNNIKDIDPLGLKNYFRSIIATSKAANIKPVTILFNDDHKRKNSSINRKIKDNILKENAYKRLRLALQINNEIMDTISSSMEVPVIYYNKWEPSNQSYWIDHCHLNKFGHNEKAIFIGNYLIKNNILNN